MDLMEVLLLLFMTVPVTLGYVLIFYVLFGFMISSLVSLLYWTFKKEDQAVFIKSKSSCPQIIKLYPGLDGGFAEDKKNKILIVEDDLSLRPFWMRIFNNILSSSKIEWAISGEQASEMILNANSDGAPYKLIISDLFLAGSLTGVEVLKSPEVIKSQAQTVLVSAVNLNSIRTQVQNRSDLLSEKRTRILTKPLNVKFCRKIVTRLLSA